MSATVWTDAKRAELARLRAEAGPDASPRMLAERMGMPQSTVYAELRRQNGRPVKKGEPAKDRRVCPCGRAVFNDWWSDFRRCEPCRTGAVMPARFSDAVAVSP